MKKVWVERKGCIVCRLCEEICPDVFIVEEDGVQVKPDADLREILSIQEAAKSCPVEAIRYTR